MGLPCFSSTRSGGNGSLCGSGLPRTRAHAGGPSCSRCLSGRTSSSLGTHAVPACWPSKCSAESPGAGGERAGAAVSGGVPYRSPAERVPGVRASVASDAAARRHPAQRTLAGRPRGAGIVFRATSILDRRARVGTTRCSDCVPRPSGSRPARIAPNVEQPQHRHARLDRRDTSQERFDRPATITSQEPVERHGSGSHPPGGIAQPHK